MDGPRMVGRPASDAYRGLALLPDGEIRSYMYGHQPLKEDDTEREKPGWLYSHDNGETWLWRDAPEDFVGADVCSPVSGHWMRMVGHEDGIGLARSASPDGPWTIEKVTDEDLIMQRAPQWIRSGKRMIVCCHYARRGEPVYRLQMKPQGGAAVLISDDDGHTWRISQPVTAPDMQPMGVHRGMRWNHGAVEPTVVELSDGRLYMLCRTAQERLYEAWSHDGGETWENIGPSRFFACNTMPVLGKLRDGRILLLWNNTTQLPKRASSTELWTDAFTDRDALHAAISDDDGQTWRGFRELTLNDRRHDADYGLTGGIDRSVHQSQFHEMADDRIIAAVGQHWLHRKLLVFEPDWLLETSRTAMFDAEMAQFSTQLYQKNICGHCALNRKPGGAMVQHPDDPTKLALHIRRCRNPDLLDERGGAVWNFPACFAGSLTIRFQLLTGFGGVQLTLTDRWFNPTDPVVHEIGPFTLEIPADLWLTGDVYLQHNRWHELRIAWERVNNKHQHPGAVWHIDGVKMDRRLGMWRPSFIGLSYLHMVSKAISEDAGMLIDHITTQGQDN